MDYLEHLEAHCGEFVTGYDVPDLLEDHVQILKLEEPKPSDIVTIATLGLHLHSFQFEDGSVAHQDLLFRFKQKRAEQDIVQLVWHLATHALETHQAFDLGEYFSLPKGVLKRYKFSSIYVTAPFYSDPSFLKYEGEPHDVLVVWFVPIFPSEERFIEEHGAEAFDELLFETDDELLDLKRKPLV
ncbi:suppressor of fused domain protein [Exiguobacterium sp. SL-10]|uniref:suppressor of fused domain protein n=1 Tax=Exiguobacterium sp. SL-10 TaxID=2510962 RepID=UPI001039BEDF|nr:suppressor of fused domain protein [Exiguobacterium sp. SL-10]TCI30660.1 suppressor of fused domain protein [Exiguobacterium sp. SL-10]